MPNRALSMPFFLPLSLLVHAALLLSFWTPENPEAKNIEISLVFGQGQAPASGGDGKTVGAKRAFKPKPVVTPQKNPEAITQEVAPKEEIAAHAGEAGAGESIGSVRGDGQGGGNSLSSEARYMAQIQQKIDQAKFYPRQAKMLSHEGQVMVSITLNRSGKLLSAKVVQGCMHNILNKAAIETVERVGRFPEIPRDMPFETVNYIVPIKFSISL